MLREGKDISPRAFYILEACHADDRRPSQMPH